MNIAKMYNKKSLMKTTPNLRFYDIKCGIVNTKLSGKQTVADKPQMYRK